MMKLKKTFKRQHDQRDCGVACFYSLVQYYGGSVKLEDLRQWSGTNHQGTTLLGLYQAANKAGFNAEGCEADQDALIKHGEPVILHVNISDNMPHFIVYYGDKNGKAIIGDPASGLKLMAYEELNSIWISKSCLVLSPGDRFKKYKAESKVKRKWFTNLIIDDMQVIFASVIIGLLSAVLGLSLAVFNQKLIDDILPEGDQVKMFAAIGLLGFMLLVKSLLNFVRRRVLLQQGKNFNVKIATRFFNQLLFLPKVFYNSRRSGDLIARLNDTTRIQKFITRTLGNMTVSLIVLIVTISAIFIYNYKIGCISLLIIPVYTLILLRINGDIVKRQRKVMEHYAHSESFYLNTLQGIDTVHDHGKDKYFGDRNVTIYEDYQAQVFKLGGLTIKLNFVVETVATFLLITVVGFGVYQVGSGVMKAGELLAIITLVSTLIPVITGLLINLIDVQEARIAFDRMYEFIKISNDSEMKGNVANTLFPLEINNVSFRFPGRTLLLRQIDLRVDNHQIVALLGESGSGKSTLIDLIKGDYEPEKGSIRYNHSDINRRDPIQLKKSIGIVPQTITLFNETVLFNITLKDNTEKTFNDLKVWLQKIELWDYFAELPGGLLTPVGEGGVNLSGGQKQVLALARALYKNPQLLILDEATSAMDRLREKRIMQLLLKLKSKMAIIFITHRVHILDGFVDYIYILEEQRIKSQGTPLQLLEGDNYYSSFWKEFGVAPIR